MKCNTCGNLETKLLLRNFPSHNRNGYFDLYRCYRCDVHFAYPYEIDRALYNEVYMKNKPEESYYGVLFEQARKIKMEKNPMHFLSNSVHNYFAVEDYVSDKQDLEILEIGCGYGYLTWTLQKRGHHAYGIDVSDNAIVFAKNYFGSMYEVADVHQFLERNPGKKFDLIVSTEVIEHVPSPADFLKNCLALLKDEGRVVLTTPNKSFYPKDTIWASDLPPVHVTFMSPRTFAYLADKNNLDLRYVKFSRHLAVNEKLNKFVTYLMSRGNKDLASVGGETGAHKSGGGGGSLLKRVLRALLVEFLPVRYLCNFFYQLLFRGVNYDSTLGVILWKHT